MPLKSQLTSRLLIASFIGFFCASSNTQFAQGQNDAFVQNIQPFLKNYCFECHDGESGDFEGEIDLGSFKSMTDVTGSLDTWSAVLDVLDQGDMPPEDSPQPKAEELDFVQSWILDTLASADNTKSLSMIRRLNRFEYENTIRDLFRLERECFNNPARVVETTDYFKPGSGKMPRYVLALSSFNNSQRRHSDLPGVSNLPVDPPTEHGFSNEHTALSLSPLLMETYFEIATTLLNNPEFKDISAVWPMMFEPQSDDDDEQLQQATENLALFLPRAFRRDVDSNELSIYIDLFASEFSSAESNSQSNSQANLQSNSQSYTAAMKTTVAAILVSSNFLFRNDSPESPLGFKSENQFGLASRLSYFLWASMPDDSLLQAAREGRLDQPAELRRQVRRMLDDKKCKSLSTDFGMQWLKLQRVASAIPDRDKFPAYYRQTMSPPGTSMMVEQLLLFETIMVENRSIMEFISADFSYLNRSLMDWYQLNPTEVLGYSPDPDDIDDFFRIKWPNLHRGGVIASGAMLLSTSTTTRSSPVFRGAWILDVVFNQPPPPPPADVKPLEESEDASEETLSIRARLDKHREDPACASCHNRMDPLGFALERFDATGRWRTKYENGAEIDDIGDIQGDFYQGPARFKNVILRQKPRFVQAFVEHTMKYALGRQLHFSDENEIRRITEEVIKRDCRFDAVIENVVLSRLFRQTPETN